MTHESPVNPLPPVVVALFLLVAGTEVVLSLAGMGFVGGQMGIGWRGIAVQDYGFTPEVFQRVVGWGDYSLDMLRRFVTYSFVHANFTHAAFGAVLLLALGKFVAEVFHPVAVVILFVISAVGGAVGFALMVRDPVWLIGVFPAVYGLIGAFTYLTWLRLRHMGQNQLLAFRLIGALMLFQLVLGLLFGGDSTWVADVAGFVCGLVASPLLAPGGWGAFVARLKQR